MNCGFHGRKLSLECQGCQSYKNPIVIQGDIWFPVIIQAHIWFVWYPGYHKKAIHFLKGGLKDPNCDAHFDSSKINMISVLYLPDMIFDFPGYRTGSNMKVWFPGNHKRIINWKHILFLKSFKNKRRSISNVLWANFVHNKEGCIFSCLSYQVISEYMNTLQSYKNQNTLSGSIHQQKLS